MDRGCALPGCREAAACPARFCRGHLVTRAVKARHTWSLTAKLLGLIELVALLALPRPWKGWPSARYSAWFQLMPIPRSNRPPLSTASWEVPFPRRPAADTDSDTSVVVPDERSHT